MVKNLVILIILLVFVGSAMAEDKQIIIHETKEELRQQEYFPQGRDQALKEHQEAVRANQERRQKTREFLIGDGKDNDNPFLRETLQEHDRRDKEEVEQEAKREKEIKESPVYEVPKVLTSTEKNKE